MLGLGLYTIKVINVFTGETTLETAEHLGIDYTRVPNRWSEASVTLPNSVVGRAETTSWTHEIELWRGKHLAWAGPIVRRKAKYDTLTLFCKDPSVYWDTRLTHETFDFSLPGHFADASDVFLKVHESGMAPDPRRFTITMSPANVIVQERYEINTPIKQIMQDMAQWVDWTFVGRTGYGGGGEITIAPIVRLNDDSWRDVTQIEIEEVGEITTRLVLLGSMANFVEGGGALAQFYREVSGLAKPYGLHEAAITVNSFTRTEQIDQFAKQTMARTGKLGLYLQTGAGGGLSPTADVDIRDLVPGARVLIQSAVTAIKTRYWCRLSALRVRIDPATMDEVVAIDTEPLGATNEHTGEVLRYDVEVN